MKYISYEEAYRRAARLAFTDKVKQMSDSRLSTEFARVLLASYQDDMQACEQLDRLAQLFTQ